MSRKLDSPGDKKTNTQVMVTPAERLELFAAAEREGMPFSIWARRELLRVARGGAGFGAK